MLWREGEENEREEKGGRVEKKNEQRSLDRMQCDSLLSCTDDNTQSYSWPANFLIFLPRSK